MAERRKRRRGRRGGEAQHPAHVAGADGGHRISLPPTPPLSPPATNASSLTARHRCLLSRPPPTPPLSYRQRHPPHPQVEDDNDELGRDGSDGVSEARSGRAESATPRGRATGPSPCAARPSA
uniref:Uncharacterized protein n=1 Tax=Oryza nivara TaxID=4536 RepID=A0A0E0GMM6_ORYNI